MKRDLDDPTRVEIERRLSQEEYLKLLMEADTDMRQIRKTRYCLTYRNRYFEVDVYPFWKDKAILKVPLREEDGPVKFPKFVHVIEEITGNDSYRNRALAANSNR